MDVVGLPMLFKTNGVWMMITEAHLDGSYPATHIDNAGTDKAYKIRFPEADEPIVPDAVETGIGIAVVHSLACYYIGDDLNTTFQTQ